MDFKQTNDFFNNCKFSKLKEYLEEAKSAKNKDLKNQIRKIMTKKYLEHKKNKTIKNYNLSDQKNIIKFPIINNKPLPIPQIPQIPQILQIPSTPPIPQNPTVIQYNNKNDKYSNILANQIGIRNRMDSNLSILESIKNNNKNDFIKPYV